MLSWILLIEDEKQRGFIESIYLDYGKLIYHIAYGVLKNHHDTEDIVNTTMLNLFKKIDTLQGLTQIKLQAYIVFAAKNAALNLLKKQKRTHEQLLTDPEDWNYFEDKAQETVDAQLLYATDIQELYDALNKIDEKEKNLLQMKYFLKLSDEEIAEQVEIGKNSVRYYLTLARRSLISTINKGP